MVLVVRGISRSKFLKQVIDKSDMKFLVLLLLFVSLSAQSAVRFNPNNNMWEGNICMNNIGWQFVDWRPLGSLCWIHIPGRQPMQGTIINL